MDGTVFFVAGIALVVAALVLSAVGIRGREEFPPRATLIGLTGGFAALVAVTAAFAIVNAREEQETRNEELAAEQEEVEQVAEGEEQGGGEVSGGEQSLDLTSPDDGSLVFDPDGLEASAGTVTISYANPSPVQHNVAVEQEGETLGESDLITDSETTLTVDVVPGDYVFYCTVPGHREGGMEGDLTVN